jgi:hypothetical protein
LIDFVVLIDFYILISFYKKIGNDRGKGLRPTAACSAVLKGQLQRVKVKERLGLQLRAGGGVPTDALLVARLSAAAMGARLGLLAAQSSPIANGRMGLSTIAAASSGARLNPSLPTFSATSKASIK